MARNRYTIAKKPNDWTENQKIKAKLLSKNYPLLHKVYKHTLAFRNIYEQTSRTLAKEKILNCIEKTKLLEMTVFNTAANSLKYYLETILNLFIKRHTNANNTFNSKIKLFRANQIGIVDVKFFIFRMEKLSA